MEWSFLKSGLSASLTLSFLAMRFATNQDKTLKYFLKLEFIKKIIEKSLFSRGFILVIF